MWQALHFMHMSALTEPYTQMKVTLNNPHQLQKLWSWTAANSRLANTRSYLSICYNTQMSPTERCVRAPLLPGIIPKTFTAVQRRGLALMILSDTHEFRIEMLHLTVTNPPDSNAPNWSVNADWPLSSYQRPSRFDMAMSLIYCWHHSERLNCPDSFDAGVSCLISLVLVVVRPNSVSFQRYLLCVCLRADALNVALCEAYVEELLPNDFVVAARGPLSQGAARIRRLPFRCHHTIRNWFWAVYLAASISLLECQHFYRHSFRWMCHSEWWVIHLICLCQVR